MDPHRLEQLRDCCRDDAAFEQMKAILRADSRQQHLTAANIQPTARKFSHSATSLPAQLPSPSLPSPSLPAQLPAQSRPIQQSHRPILLRVIARIRSSLEPQVILRVATSEVRQLVQADRVSIFQFTPNTHYREGEFVAEDALPGLPSVLRDEAWNPCFGDRFAARYQQGYVHVVADIQSTTLGDYYLQQLAHLGVHASITLPINRGETLWGLLCIHQCHAPRDWTPDEIELVSHVAGQVGVALQQAELLTRTRDALGQSEIKFQRLAERVPGIIFQGMFDFQANLSFSYISPGCQRIYGFTAGEILRNSSLVIEAVHPDDVTTFEAAIETAIQTLRPWRWEGRIQMPSGQIKWLRGDAHLELREDGILADGLLIDITEQKQTEAALRTSESEIRALFAAIPDAVFVIDSSGRLRRLSSSHPVILYRPVEERSDKTLHDIFPQADADRFLSYVQQVLRSQQTVTMEYALTVDQSDMWFSASISPVTDDTVIWVARDITDRRQIEEALRASEREYRTLVENANSVILRWDASGNVTFFNEFAQRFFGYSEEDILGRNVLGTILPSVDSQGNDLAAMLQDLIKHPEQYITHEHENMRRNGDRVWLEWTNKAMFNEQGELVSMLSVGLDATERRHAQQALEQAKREAEAANRAKGEFLAMMSHEIRTPMNAVIGMTGLLLDTDLTPEQRDFAETIRNSGDALLTIINDILDFSKIESGKLDLEEHPFHLRDCIEGVIDLLAPKAAEKRLELAYYIDPRVPVMVQGDVTRLRQVLMNLLSNAVKFTDVGEVVVNVTAHQLGRSRLITDNPPTALPSAYANIYPIYELEFNVRDTGIGIPPDRLDRLFQSFSQVDTSTTRQYGGTGLGLAISKRLCEMMGGSLWVDSHGQVGGDPPAGWQASWQLEANYGENSRAPGLQGATFSFTIVAPAVALPTPTQPTTELIGKRLLIVDDNATNRKLLTLQAQSWGMATQSVPSGTDALRLLSQGGSFDVAIVDMQMPQMDGVTFASIIQRQTTQQGLPIVLLTSVGRIEPLPEQDNPKLAAYLNKPVKPAQLHATLHQVLSPTPTLAHLPRPHTEKTDTNLAAQLPLRILLAEDHAINQKLALLLLKRLGYRADVAGNGIEVLEALRRQFYDVILMDVQMPEMDGLAAARQICRDWSVADRPYIIALTASAMQGDREECLNAGMDDYITKPIQFEALVQVLKRCQTKVRFQETHTIPQDLFGSVLTTQPGELVLQNAMTLNAIAPAPPAASSVLDPDILDAIRAMADDDEDDFLADMIDCYLQDTPAQMQTMLTAIAHNDPPALKQSSHPLKSMSAAVGATSFAQHCHDLEVMATSGTISLTSGQIDRLKADYQQVRAALAQVRSATSLGSRIT